MPSKCPHCGENAVSWEGYGTQDDDKTQRVCLECGAVIEEGSFQNEAFCKGGTQPLPLYQDFQPTGAQNSTLPKDYVDRSSKTVKVSEGKKLGIKKIKHLAQFVGNQGKLLTQEAIDLYARLYRHESFKSARVEKKEILAGCCVFIVCRQHDVPMTVSHMCVLLGCKSQDFGFQLRKIQKELAIPINGLDLEALIDMTCTKAGLDMEVACRVKQLIPILKQTWVTEGRTIEPVIKTASFVAWRSQEADTRHKESIKHFMESRGWKHTRHICRIHNEICDKLCKLASHIQWLTPADIQPKLIYLHLKDIISYQKVLFYELADSTTATENECASVENSCNGSDEKPCDIKLKQEPSGSDVQLHPDNYLSLHGLNQQNDKVLDKYVNTATAYPMFSSENERKRKNTSEFHEYSFLPQCISNPPKKYGAKKVSIVADVTKYEVEHMDSENLSERDIPEKDLNQFIRTPKEVENMNAVRNHLMNPKRRK